MVSAELALAFPAVVLVLALALAGMTLAVDLVRCEDAARAGARAASRGDSPAVVQEVVRSRAPSGAELSVSSAGDRVVVTVRAPDRAGPLPLPVATGRAEARWEPGAGP